MTDKQIIIDGEQCEYLRDTGLCRLTYCFTEKSYNCSMCNDNPNCYYKKLKAKEQECKELKEQMYGYSCPRGQDVQYCGFLKELGDVNIELDQLKSENKHLNDLLNQALKELEAIQNAYEERE